jgi:hypothetical protein
MRNHYRPVNEKHTDIRRETVSMVNMPQLATMSLINLFCQIAAARDQV